MCNRKANSLTAITKFGSLELEASQESNTLVNYSTLAKLESGASNFTEECRILDLPIYPHPVTRDGEFRRIS
ncbi:MAG: hypothetical protein V7K57_01570 [Nostoc sp.]